MPKTWILRNYVWGVITHHCGDFSDILIKSPLKLVHGLVITSLSLWASNYLSIPSPRCFFSHSLLVKVRVNHYDDVIMTMLASQITSLTVVYSTVYSDADQSKHRSSASLAFVWGIHRGPVNSPLKWPVTRKMFPFDDVIMSSAILCWWKSE